MLNIEYGSYQKLYDKYGEDFIYDPDMYFDNTYDEEWLISDMAKEIIKDIDKSGGAKTLILIYNNPDLIINASACGDNCAKWLLKIAENKDIYIRLLHNMNFGKEFEINVINTNQIVHSMPELIQINGDILRG